MPLYNKCHYINVLTLYYNPQAAAISTYNGGGRHFETSVLFGCPIGVNSYWAQGLKPPPHFYDHGARLYDEPPPRFCDVILS